MGVRAGGVLAAAGGAGVDGERSRSASGRPRRVRGRRGLRRLGGQGAAEWELAARGGLEGAIFAWGDEELPGGRAAANTWQGRFPWENLRRDGFEGTSPVGSFPANGFGLFDVCGNVWEWTSDRYRDAGGERRCCVGADPAAADGAAAAIPRRVIKGGSHLCAPSYCFRYRPAARQGQAVDSSTGHIGIRCVLRPR